MELALCDDPMNSDDPVRNEIGPGRFQYLRKDQLPHSKWSERRATTCFIIAMIFDILRLYEWPFLFCETRECRKVT